MKKYDCLALGEALIDYIPTEQKICGQYKSAVGGAPLNVAMGFGKLGGKTALISRVGHDPLGAEIIRTLKDGHVDSAMVQVDHERHTPVTIVLPDTEDMMRYIIYRENCADSALEPAEIPEGIFTETYVLHTGVLLCAFPHTAETVKKIVGDAKRQGALISLDVNMRIWCWQSTEKMVAESMELAEMSDIIKLTHEEAEMMKLPVESCAKEGKLILVTNGAEDVRIYWRGQLFKKPVEQVRVVDVTGAGDAFMSAFLYQYISYLKSGAEIGPGEIDRCTDIAVRAGCHAVQTLGAHSSYPTYEDIFE